jgi:hypothetical protein
MDFLLLFVFWLFLCIAAGMFANIRRNRDGTGWFLIALIASPLVAFLLLAILKPEVRKPRYGTAHALLALGIAVGSLAAVFYTIEHVWPNRDPAQVAYGQQTFEQKQRAELERRNQTGQ